MQFFDNANTYKLFGLFIKRERVRKELYQREVAERLGISQAYYSQLESGVRQVDLSMALNICGLLDIDFNDFLLFLKENKKKPHGFKSTEKEQHPE